MSGKECATGEPMVEDAEECLAWHHKRVDTRAKDAERLGVPLVITEFGACLTEGPCTQEINQVADVADDNLVGCAYWQFKTYADLTTSAGTGSEGFWNQDGTLQAYKVKALARSYMPYTQGILSSMNFDTKTADFSAEFTYDGKAGETVAYLNQDYWYTAGSPPNVSILVNDASVDSASVGAAYTNNYYSFDLSKNSTVKAGDKVTFKATNSH